MGLGTRLFLEHLPLILNVLYRDFAVPSTDLWTTESLTHTTPTPPTVNTPGSTTPRFSQAPSRNFIHSLRASALSHRGVVLHFYITPCSSCVAVICSRHPWPCLRTSLRALLPGMPSSSPTHHLRNPDEVQHTPYTSPSLSI